VPDAEHLHFPPPDELALSTMARINLPPLTRGVLAALVFFTLVNFALRPHADWVEKVEKPIIGVGNGVPWLTIVPRHSVPWYPWVFALATVVEQNVLGLITTGLTVFYGGRYLERAWGSHEFTKFMLFVAMIPNLLTYVLYVAGYLLTSKGSMM
jgi:membrane associated rhomboid family serine protease